jgi:hypothetical protein
MLEAKMSNSVNEKAKNFRWYLCQEDSLKSWNCKKVSAEKALDPFGGEGFTMAVPISKLFPEFLDEYLVRSEVKKATHVTFSK